MTFGSPAEIWVLIAAMTGGAVVIFGLIIERFAEWLDDRFLPQYKAHKRLEDFGLGFVILGILWEIAIGGWAANDAWQTRQMTIHNDPLNQSISRISVIVSFMVKKNNTEENPVWGNRMRVATIACCESNLVAGKIVVIASEIYFLDAATFDRYEGTKMTQYVLHFNLENDVKPFDPFNKNIADKNVGWIINDVHFLDIDTKFLPQNTEVLDGQAVVMVNDRQKWFNIPAQQDSDPDAGKIGFGYLVVASDEATQKNDKANIPGLLAK